MKLFCQTFSKTAPTPLEKPLHLRSQNRSCFWKSRSPDKQALNPFPANQPGPLFTLHMPSSEPSPVNQTPLSSSRSCAPPRAVRTRPRRRGRGWPRQLLSSSSTRGAHAAPPARAWAAPAAPPPPPRAAPAAPLLLLAQPLLLHARRRHGRPGRRDWTDGEARRGRWGAACLGGAVGRARTAGAARAARRCGGGAAARASGRRRVERRWPSRALFF